MPLEYDFDKIPPTFRKESRKFFTLSLNRVFYAPLKITNSFARNFDRKKLFYFFFNSLEIVLISNNGESIQHAKIIFEKKKKMFQLKHWHNKLRIISLSYVCLFIKLRLFVRKMVTSIR